jgi:CO/xanthine dehydrogenase Mo-binding subunit
MVTASAVPAVMEAAGKAIDALLATAVKAHGSKFAGRKASELEYPNGFVRAKGESASSGIPFADLLRAGNLRSVSGLEVFPQPARRAQPDRRRRRHGHRHEPVRRNFVRSA